jgi:serine phosphatase RsbU (regulator of sigma subunit)
MWAKLSGLQFRMTVSYALTTVAAVLVIEILAGATVWTLLTRGQVADSGMVAGARQIAKVYALAAAAQAGGPALDPRTTFEPGQPSSIALGTEYFPSSNGLQYRDARSLGATGAAFALLVAPDGRVVASTDPGRYPSSASAAQLFPGRTQIIGSALAGTPDSVVDRSTGDPVVAAAEPVWSNVRQPIGAVYVQEPEIFRANFLGGISALVLASAVFWLVFTVPVGGLFGLMTTRGLVRRVRRLANATAQFAAGDYSQRVPVTKADEIGQLEQHFNQMAHELVDSMAQRQALVEQQARQEERARIEQEMSTAQHIQQSLLPKEVPALPGWQFTPYYKPAREVGGDFYDFLSFDDGRLGIVIGAVTGKGIPAALVMAITRTTLRTAARASASPGEVLARVNDLLCGDIPPGMFVTCFYAVLNPDDGRVSFANAGHDTPYRQHGNGVSELRATGLPLGIMAGTSYDECDVALTPGDSVLLYSDGLVEAHNAGREMFGFPRLAALLGREAGDTHLVDCLLNELATFTGGDWEQEDDVTLVVVNRAGPILAAAT